jgi:transposase
MSKNKRHVVRLSEEERAELTALVSVGKASARKLTRARVLLKADQGEGGPGWTDEQIAKALESSRHTVRGIRKRYAERGTQGAINRKKGKCSTVRVRKLDGEAEARLVAIACGPPPPGRANWSMRLLAGKLVALQLVDTISHDTVWRTLKKTNSSHT